MPTSAESPIPRSVPSQPRPSSSPNREMFSSGGPTEILAGRRNRGALELVARDHDGRRVGISRVEGVWICQCAPGRENPDCQHQQAAKRWREVFA